MELALRHSSGRRAAQSRPAVRPRLRRSLARGYRAMLRDADDPSFWISARVPLRRDEVLAARPDIEALVARLEDTARPVDPAAVQLARELLCDGTGPLYTWAEPGTVRRRVRVILDALG